MEDRRMCKKLLMMLMCICVLVAGCSKKPLNSMTIGQVRQLVLDWGYGKLPEQQVEGADEIRKELEVLEEQLKEQEAKDKAQLDLLWKQISEQKADRENQVHLLRKQYEAEAAESLKQLRLLEEKKLEAFREYSEIPVGWRAGLSKGTNEEERRWAAIKMKYEIAKKEWEAQSDLQPQYYPVNYNKRLDPREEQCREQWQEAEGKHSSLKAQLRLQQGEFSDKKIGPLRKRLEPDESVKTFYKVFGEPKDKSLIGDNYYFRYRCKDGLVVLEIYASLFDNDRVIIKDVSML